MNLKEKISVIMLALIFVIASAYVFNAGAGERTVRQLAAGSYENVKIVPVTSWSEPGTPLGPTVTGGTRVTGIWGRTLKTIPISSAMTGPTIRHKEGTTGTPTGKPIIRRVTGCRELTG